MITKGNRYYTEHLMIDYSLREGNFSMKEKHLHNEYEIYLLLDGEGTCFIDNANCSMKKGDLVFIDSQTAHATDFSNCPVHKRLLIEMDSHYFEEPILLVSSISLTNFFKNNMGVVSLQDADFKKAKNILTSIYNEAKEQNENYEYMVSLKLAEFFITLNRITEKNLFSSSFAEIKKPQLQIVKKAVEFILKNLDKNISLNSVSEYLYINKSHLSRIFKEVTGMTVHEYMNVHRIRKAREYLIETDLNIDEIAKYCGFQSTTYFTTVFTNHTTFSPSRYRKNQQQLQMTNRLTHS